MQRRQPVIAFLVASPFEVLDLTGPVSVFERAATDRRHRRYRSISCSCRRKFGACSCRGDCPHDGALPNPSRRTNPVQYSFGAAGEHRRRPNARAACLGQSASESKTGCRTPRGHRGDESADIDASVQSPVQYDSRALGAIASR